MFSFAVTEPAEKKLTAYAALLRQWNPKINLVSPTTLPALEQRHIADCAQLVPHIPQDACEVLDVGSGAGLPGLILAILAPQHHYTLVERDHRKAAFLFTAKQQLELENVTVLNDDVRNISKQYQVITCRAWADLSEILNLTSPLLAQNGAWLLLKGKGFDGELSSRETAFHLTIDKVPSIVSRDGWVVRIQKAS